MFSIINIFEYVLKQKEMLLLDECHAVLSIHWIIMWFMYYRQKMAPKTRSKYERLIRPFQSEINKMYERLKFEFYDQLLYESEFVKVLCKQLIEAMGPVGIIEDFSQFGRSKKWRVKRNDMKCLYYKCKRQRSINGEEPAWTLRKCKGCRVARYCSKSCQKKDWKFGHHKEICAKFNHL